MPITRPIPADPEVLHRELAQAAAQQRANKAAILAHLAEIDVRRVHLKTGYNSLEEFCLRELNVDEDEIEAYVLVARTARSFPAIFPALADGRLHLAAVVMLAPHLSTETADDLLASATHKNAEEVEQLLRKRFPERFEDAWIPLQV